jgi:hypothetical protein
VVARNQRPNEVDPVIVRVLTARVVPDRAARLNELLRGKLDDLRQQPGLVYAKLARRFAEDGDEEVILFEEWRSPSDLWAWTDGHLGRARLLPGTDLLVDELTITHYEALDVFPDDLELSVTLTDRPRDTRLGGSGGSLG